MVQFQGSRSIQCTTLNFQHERRNRASPLFKTCLQQANWPSILTLIRAVTEASREPVVFGCLLRDDPDHRGDRDCHVDPGRHDAPHPHGEVIRRDRDRGPAR
jgi:hypothetical protein